MGLRWVLMESMISFVRRKLKEVGSRRFSAIAREAGVADSLPRKLATGERDNPRIRTIEPLVDYFLAVESGERQLPPDESDACNDVDRDHQEEPHRKAA